MVIFGNLSSGRPYFRLWCRSSWDIVSVQLEGTQLRLEPGETVIPHGPDRDLTIAEATVTDWLTAPGCRIKSRELCPPRFLYQINASRN
jgi:hypothetical protein